MKRQKLYDHNYMKAYDSLDLTNSNDKYVHKMCNAKSPKESYITPQQKLQVPCETGQSNNINLEIQNENQNNQRKSNKNSLSYFSSNMRRKGIICKENKYHKGRLLKLCITRGPSI